MNDDIEELLQRLIRVETRLCKLMQFLGMEQGEIQGRQQS